MTQTNRLPASGRLSWNATVGATLEEPSHRLARLAGALVGAPLSVVCLETGGPPVLRGYTAGNGAGPVKVEITPFWMELTVRMRERRAATAFPDLRTLPRNILARLSPPPGSCAFLGVPLLDQRLHYLGAIWVGDHRSRDWTTSEIERLQDLSVAASAEIEFRLREFGRSARAQRGELLARDEVDSYLTEAWARIEAGNASRRERPADVLLQEIGTALEELRVSSEELHLVNEELRSSQYLIEQERAHYRELFDCVPYPYLMTTEEGVIQEVNAGAVELFGYRAQALVGKPLTVFLGESNRKDFRARLRQLTGGSRQEWTVQIHPRGHQPRTMICAAAALRSRESGTERIYWLLRDSDMEPLREDAAADTHRQGTEQRFGAHDASEAPVQDFEELLSRVGRQTGVQLADQLRDLIASGVHLGVLQVGQRLPSIRTMAETFEVTSYAALRAYTTLEEEGVVERRERSGIYLAAMDRPIAMRIPETAEWMVEVLTSASRHQLPIPQLVDLIQRWTATVPVRCVCVESCADTRSALGYEISHQFAVATTELPISELHGADGATLPLAALPRAVHDAHMLVTTAFHAGEVRAVADALGKPMLVATANPATVRAVEERVSAHDLTVVCTDPAYGERLRTLRGGMYRDRIRVVTCDDAAALAGLDRTEPVLLTLAARQRITGATLRLIAPPYPATSPDFARKMADTLIRLNLGATRS